MAETKPITLSTLKGGALEERFQRELTRVLSNIRDPNTAQASVRSVHIKLTFKPSEDRQFAGVTAQVSSKLAPDKPITTFTLFDRDGDDLVVAVERIQTGRDGDDPRQAELRGPGTVTPIRKETS